MSEGTSQAISNLPTGEMRNELAKLGIDTSLVNHLELYDRLKQVPMKDRGKTSILVGCTGGSERSVRFGKLAKQMGFDVASLSNPKAYHKPYGVPIDELIDPSAEATFPDGNIKFPNMNKPVSYMIVFTNDILGKDRKVEIHDRYTSRVVSAISMGLLEASQKTGDKPKGVSLITVPATEREIEQLERLSMVEE